MLELVEVSGGTRIRLRVKPGAHKSQILGTHAGALKLGVTAAPEKGKANKAVIRLLADALELAPSAIELVAGRTSTDKTVLVPLSAPAIRDRLFPDEDCPRLSP